MCRHPLEIASTKNVCAAKGVVLYLMLKQIHGRRTGKVAICNKVEKWESRGVARLIGGIDMKDKEN